MVQSGRLRMCRAAGAETGAPRATRSGLDHASVSTEITGGAEEGGEGLGGVLNITPIFYNNNNNPPGLVD